VGTPARLHGGELERRIVTVLFCDLAGFTSLSERLDAEDVAIVQEAYFAAVRSAVTRHGGTLEKFIGDAAVGVFGVPVAGEDDAVRAVRSGLAIVGALEQLTSRLRLDAGALHVRVGVNTGEAVVHPSPAPGEAMVTGDVVNTAARLQAAASLNSVLIGPETALAAAHLVELEPAEALSLKGKAEPVRAARATAALADPERERTMGMLRAPTIGREAELARLGLMLDECASGAVRRLAIVAPPGTGKTRLLDDLAGVAAGRGAHVRRGRARPDALSPFGPVAELIAAAQAAVGVRTERELHGRLARTLGDERAGVVAAEVAALLGHEDGAVAAGEEDARRAARFGAWSEALGALAERAELWLLEDLHWSSGDLRAFLDAAHTGADQGRLIVCTARPSLLESDAAWLAGGDTVELEPLSAGSAAELVRGLVGEALPPDLVTRIAEASGGNPLFVEELLRAWAGSGLLERNNGAWELARTVEDIELPLTVQSVYAAQLDDLPPSARAVVRRASVAGRQFPRAALEILGADGNDGLAALDRRGIIGPAVADPVLGESFVFRHALLRDVGYASLARAERALLHVRMARWLEARGDEWPSELAEVTARHYAAALSAAPTLAPDVGDGLTRDEAADFAAAWFERAGIASLSAAAYDAAAGLFLRALELTEEGAARPRAARLLGFARATAFTADMDAGLQAAEEALALLRGAAAADATSADLREELSRAVALVGAIYGQQLRFQEMLTLAEATLDSLGDRGDTATARVLLTRVMGAAMIGDEAWDDAAGDRARVLELAATLRDPELEFEARRLVALDEWTREAWTAVEQLATSLRRWPEIAEARRALAGLCLPDDPDGTLVAAGRLAAFAAAHQLEESGAWADYYRAEAGFVRGDWAAAIEAGLAALAVAEERSYHRAAVRTWHVLVPVATERGEHEILERAVRWYASLDGFPETPYGLLQRGAVDVLLGRGGVAPPHVPRLERLEASFAEGGALPSWLEAVDVVIAEAIAAGDVDSARTASVTLAAAQARIPSTVGDATCRLVRARVAVAAGEHPQGLRDLARDLRAANLPWLLLKCLRLLPDPSPDEHAEVLELARRLGSARAHGE
jgi:class 3 adenylate cyclase